MTRTRPHLRCFAPCTPENCDNHTRASRRTIRAGTALGAGGRADLPVGIHSDTGPTGAIYLERPATARMRSARNRDARQPQKPRVYIMHAGYPMIDDLLTVLMLTRRSTSTLGSPPTQPRPASIGQLQAIADEDSPTVSCLGRSNGLGGNDRARDCRHRQGAVPVETAEARHLLQQRRALPASQQGSFVRHPCSESGPGMSLALTYPIRIAVMYLGRAS